MNKPAIWLTAIPVVVIAAVAGFWWSAPMESPPSLPMPTVSAPVAMGPSEPESTPWPTADSSAAPRHSASVLPPPSATPSRFASEEESREAALNEYDKQVSRTTIPRWWSDLNVYPEVAVVDPGSSITDVACSREMCRVEIFHSRAEVREGFKEKLVQMPSFGGAGAFRQPAEEPNKTVVYLFPYVVFPEGATEEDVQTASEALIQKLQP